MNKSSLYNKSSRALVPRDFFFPFGNKLIEAGYVQREELKLALKQKENSGQSLIKILEEITKRKLPSELVRQYKKHQLFELKVFYGVDCVDPEIDNIASIEMALLIEKVIPIEICRRYKLLPIKKEEEVLLVAMVNPDDLEAYDELRRILGQKHLVLQRMVITKEDYQNLLDNYQQAESKRDKERAEDLKQKALEKLSDVTEIIDNIEAAPDEIGDESDVITDENDKNSPKLN